MFLDHLCYIRNLPVFISAVRVEDVSNHRTSLVYTSPFRPAVVGNPANQMPIEMQPVYAMYREARNTGSDFYRFLCFYKILEGLLGKMRAGARRRAREQSIEISVLPEIVPDSSECDAVLRPYVGKSIKNFFDNFLDPKFRNAVAHFITDDGAILQVSDPDRSTEFSSVMLICETCVRIVIANHEALLAQIAAAHGSHS